MSYEVLLLGLLVGAANYCFRYLPLRLRVGNARPTKRGAVGILLDTLSAYFTADAEACLYRPTSG